MSPNFKKFKQLHESSQLLILPNAWDAASAIILAKKGYPAIATSSAAVAGSLGYEDGEGMPFEEYLFVIKRILASVNVPVSVDIEMGYGRTDEDILANLLTLSIMGVAGINIEDSFITPSGRQLKDAREFAGRLAFLRKKLSESGVDLFINVRSDTYLIGVADARAETRLRMPLYAAAGASGLFLPCIQEETDIIDAITHAGSLPVNVMWMPKLPTPERLQALGVHRLSMGPYFYSNSYQRLEETAELFIHHTKQFA